MNTAVRIFLAFLFFMTGCYIAFWIPFILLSGMHNGVVVASAVSLILATCAAILVWKKIGADLGNPSGGSWNYVLMGGITVGAIGFIVGTLPPMIIKPYSYLGPLPGILFTGPVGFFIGVAGGFIYWRIRFKKPKP